MMGFYSDAPKWKVVNAYSIERDENLKDRPFMVTCVPKHLNIKLNSLIPVFGAKWIDRTSRKQASNGDNVIDRGTSANNYFYGKGSIEDKITIFSLENGEEIVLKNIDFIRISVIENGLLGGKYSASVMDGIRYSGMSSKVVPEGGLMEGEPGSLYFLDGKLSLEVYLEEETFNKLFSSVISSSVKIENIHLGCVVELFQDEVEASLSDPDQEQEYGFLLGDHNKYLPSSRARLETFQIGLADIVQSSEVGFPTENLMPAAPQNLSDQSSSSDSVVLGGSNVEMIYKRTGWILAVLVMMFFTIMLQTII